MAEKKRLSRDQRGVIETGLTEGPSVSWAELGRLAGAHRSTVQREVHRHGGRQRYSADAAQLAADRQARRPRERRLAKESPLRDRVVNELRARRSPAAIAADLRAEGGAKVCAESIYLAVYAGALPVAARDCLRRRRPKRRRRQERHESRRAGLPNIAQRPALVKRAGRGRPLRARPHRRCTQRLGDAGGRRAADPVLGVGDRTGRRAVRVP